MQNVSLEERFVKWHRVRRLLWMITVAKLRVNFGLTGSRGRDSHATGPSHVSGKALEEWVRSVGGGWTIIRRPRHLRLKLNSYSHARRELPLWLYFCTQQLTVINWNVTVGHATDAVCFFLASTMIFPWLICFDKGKFSLSHVYLISVFSTVISNSCNASHRLPEVLAEFKRHLKKF